MVRRWLVLIAVAVCSAAACGTTHAAVPQQHLSRTAGVYIALIEKLRDSRPRPLYVDATATSSAGSQEIKPSGERPISTSVQREVRAATGVTFVADPKRVIVHGDHVRGSGSALTLGLVPPTGDHIIVGVGAWYGNTGGQERNYKLAVRDGKWRVVGDTGVVAVS